MDVFKDPPRNGCVNAAQLNMKALQVTKLSPNAGFLDLQGHFDRFGEIVLCRVLKDAKTGVSRGIGYVNFDREEDAAAAQAQLDGKPGPKGEEQLSVKFAEVDPSYKAVATTKVFVRYVPLHITIDDVQRAFAKYGIIRAVSIDADHSRVVRKGATPWNYAYVTFTTPKEANVAIANASNDICWSDQPLAVKPAEQDTARGIAKTSSPDAQQPRLRARLTGLPPTGSFGDWQTAHRPPTMPLPPPPPQSAPFFTTSPPLAPAFPPHIPHQLNVPHQLQQQQYPLVSFDGYHSHHAAQSNLLVMPHHLHHLQPLHQQQAPQAIAYYPSPGAPIPVFPTSGPAQMASTPQLPPGWILVPTTQTTTGVPFA